MKRIEARVERQRVERDRDAELQRIQQEQQDILDRAGETPEQRQAYEMVIGQTRGRPLKRTARKNRMRANNVRRMQTRSRTKGSRTRSGRRYKPANLN